jgi:large subunit ribosomal protein L18
MGTVRTARESLKERRLRRRRRIRGRIRGTAERPRLAVFRSHKQFYCQLIDDVRGVTLAAASTQEADLRAKTPKGGTVGAARLVGERLAEVAKARGITKAVLDRRYYLYHGRVRAFAEAARKGGLQF